MGKTPHTAFRLSDETRQQLTQIARAYETSMTDALRRATEAFAKMNTALEDRSARYPFEAHIAAGMAFRKRMGYQPGETLPQDAINAVDQAIIAANPIIREEQHYETLRDVIARLEGFGVDRDVTDHFRSLLP